jgi:hypothetical protein
MPANIGQTASVVKYIVTPWRGTADSRMSAIGGKAETATVRFDAC